VISNSPRQETPILVEANKSFAFGILFKESSGAYLDLTGCTVRIVVAKTGRRGGAEMLAQDAIVLYPKGGLVQFRFQADDLALPPGEYPYDVTLVSSLGYSVPVLKGTFEVASNVDLNADNVYGDIHPQTDVTVRLMDRNVVSITIERVDGMLSAVLDLVEKADARFQGYLAQAAASATTATKASTKVAADIATHTTWLSSIGFPFWKGTKAEYDALGAPDPRVLYLIAD
jgi:hypothetical protein